MFTHVLTHLDWTLQPVRWTLPADAAAADVAAITATLAREGQRGEWVTLAQALAMGLPAPLRKLLTTPST
jgi:A/G-specific adenine glycosylase